MTNQPDVRKEGRVVRLYEAKPEWLAALSDAARERYLAFERELRPARDVPYGAIDYSAYGGGLYYPPGVLFEGAMHVVIDDAMRELVDEKIVEWL